MDIRKLSDEYVVSSQITLGDIAAIAEAGFATVICNRPDAEEPEQPTAAEIGAACREAGMTFYYLPFAGLPIPDAIVRVHRSAIDASDGPVLAYCRSGQRSAMIWEFRA